MKTTLIPPLVFLLCLIAMVGLTMNFTQFAFLPTPWNYTGFFLFFGGLAMVGTGLRKFNALATEIHTFKSPKKLVTNGLFRYSRNPIYLGFTLALLGAATVLGNGMAYAGAGLFFLTAHFWYIPFEEKNMTAVFGTAYLEYKKKVRRWV